MSEAVEWFELSSISKTTVKFDIDKLRIINKEHLKILDSKELSRYVGFADDDIGEIAKIYLNEVSTLKELRSKIEPIFASKVIPEMFKEEAQTIKRVISSAPHFEEFNEFKSYIMKETGLEEELIFKPLSLLLIGAEDGPAVSDLYPFLKNYLGEIVK
jgi:glutamyl-tRNA synthetase